MAFASFGVRSLAALAAAFVLANSTARSARGEERAPAPAASVVLHATDDDPAAVFELRDDRGQTATWVGSRDVTARVGRYRVRVTHGGVTDEADVVADSERRLVGRTESRTGLYVGVPMIVVGSVTMVASAMVLYASGLPCSEPCSYTQDTQRRHDQKTYGTLALALAIPVTIGGIVLVATSHGSSISAEPMPRPKRTYHLGVAPTPGGAALAIGGTF